MASTSQLRGQTLVAQALWYEAPGQVSLRPEDLTTTSPGSADQTPGNEGPYPIALVGTTWSAISRGTERLVFSGRVPVGEYGCMRAPFQSGDFPFPVKYGYCAAGTVLEGPRELMGKHVFALHPHQDFFVFPAGQLAIIPSGLPDRRAALAANMETALNAVWDSGAGPGDHIIVIGAGLVGLLITYICAQLPGARVIAVDPQPGRADVAASFGADFAGADDIGALAGAGADIVFHTSATPQGLAAALSMAGFEGKVVEVSWYGDGQVAVPLGGAFHSRRLHLISSQVGHVATSRRARWPHQRRLAKALDLLCDDRLDALITEEFAFADLPKVLPDYLGGRSDGLAAVVRY